MFLRLHIGNRANQQRIEIHHVFRNQKRCQVEKTYSLRKGVQGTLKKLLAENLTKYMGKNK